MAACPTCRADVPTPLKTWVVTSEPNRGGVMMERRVGVFSCKKCNTKFPSVVGRRGLTLIEVGELQRLQAEVKALKEERRTLEEKAARLEEGRAQLERENQLLEQRVVLTGLEGRARSLQLEVLMLRQVENELKEMTSYLEHQRLYQPS